jgi:transcription initiation factor TFIIIB Brf1 subunit/transcription initiation factor TFIIB
MPADASDWIERFASGLGVPAPSAAEIEELLALAGVAAHASERIAAPISCWLVARSGCSIAAAGEVAIALANEIETEGGR